MSLGKLIISKHQPQVHSKVITIWKLHDFCHPQVISKLFKKMDKFSGGEMAAASQLLIDYENEQILVYE